MLEGVLYKPVVNHEKCNTCGICLGYCPAEIVREFRQEEDSLRAKVYKYRGIDKKLDSEIILPPCQLICPIGQDIRGYIRLIAEGKDAEALKLIRETNALPSVTSYVCSRPCESECLRNALEGPVALRALKRFITDLDDGKLQPLPVGKRNGKKVGVIGSGPAGLAAAYDLVRMGFSVTVFESMPLPGGMLRYGIPEYRLPRNILDKDVEYIKALGVEIRTNTPITDVDQLIQHYQAIILANGTWSNRHLGISDEDTQGIYHSLRFLKDINSGIAVNLGNRVVVVGGGNAALDAARVSKRLGVKDVTILYRRSEAEMPALTEEIIEAKEEGIKLNVLASPVKFIISNGKLSGLYCIRMKLGEVDASGRLQPIPIKDSEFTISTDNIIIAIGERVDRATLPKNISCTNNDTISVNPGTLETNIKAVFAAGDAVNGPTNIVEALASAKKVASSVEKYMGVLFTS
ncbi:FAD-dependent oxidoreductase [Chloroflexota bacterium]